MRLLLAVIVLSVACAVLLPAPATSADEWTPVASVYLTVVDQPWWNSVCASMVVEELINEGGFEVVPMTAWIINPGLRPECQPEHWEWRHHMIPYPYPHELRLQQCLDYEASVTNAPLIGRYTRDTGEQGDLVAARLQYEWSPFSGEPEDLEPGDYIAMSLTACPDPPACDEPSASRIELDRQKLWHEAQYNNRERTDVTEALFEDIGMKRFEITHSNDAEGRGSGAFIDNVSLNVCTRP